jgi:hypothetical protein
MQQAIDPFLNPFYGMDAASCLRERAATVDAANANAACPAAVSAPTDVRCFVVNVRP